MNARTVLVCSALLALACERKPATTPPEAGADDGAIAADDGAEDEPDEAEESGDRPAPVQQVLQIEGPLKQPAIDAMLEVKTTEIRACFDEVMQNPDGYELNGAVVVRVSVGKDGKATTAVVELDEVGHKASAQCLAKVIESADFGKQKDESTVHLPLYQNNF